MAAGKARWAERGRRDFWVKREAVAWFLETAGNPPVGSRKYPPSEQCWVHRPASKIVSAFREQPWGPPPIGSREYPPVGSRKYPPDDLERRSIRPLECG